MKILSFDVGGSKIAFALVDPNNHTMQNVNSIPTPENAEGIINIFKSACAKNEYDGIAVATAGIVCRNKLMGKPNNLPAGYESIDFKRIFPVQYIVENDANAAAWAEFEAGALQNVRHGVALTLGTDVGCSIIVNGQLIIGKGGAAGEIRTNCSGTSIKEMALQENYTDPNSFQIYTQMTKGDALAKKIYNRWKENLINTILQINQLLDVEVVALSGGLSKIVDYQTINEEIKNINSLNPPFVKPAVFSTTAGLLGAALLWQNTYRRKE